jgi:hypothetical protein
MDKMSESLEMDLLAYSSVNRTRCFNHILNLVGKALLKQFDVKKKGDDINLSNEEKALLELAEGLDQEELTMALDTEIDSDEGGIPDDALRLVKKTLNKYYSLTDEAEIYHITMSKCSYIY